MDFSSWTMILGIIATFLGIYLVQTPIQKAGAFSCAVGALLLGYFSGEHEAIGTMGRTGDSDFASGTQAVSGLGHWPLAVEFTIRVADEEQVVVERAKLRQGDKIDQRTYQRRRVRLELLSVNSDGFVVHITNETESWIDISFLARYSLANDWVQNLKKLVY